MRRADLAEDHDEAGRRGRLAGDAGLRVLGHDGVEDRVRDLVAHLVGVAFGHRLGREEVVRGVDDAGHQDSWCGDGRRVARLPAAPIGLEAGCPPTFGWRSGRCGSAGRAASEDRWPSPQPSTVPLRARSMVRLPERVDPRLAIGRSSPTGASHGPTRTCRDRPGPAYLPRGHPGRADARSTTTPSSSQYWVSRRAVARRHRGPLTYAILLPTRRRRHHGGRSPPPTAQGVAGATFDLRAGTSGRASSPAPPSMSVVASLPRCCVSALARADTGRLAGPPSTVSAPAPPMMRSAPSPPRTTSRPSPPFRTSTRHRDREYLRDPHHRARRSSRPRRSR